MTKYNKNISAIIIIICLLSVTAGIFLPKQNIKTLSTKTENNNYFSFSPITKHSPFKGEKISVIKLDGVITDSPPRSFLRDSTSSSSVLELINKAAKDRATKAIVLRINSPGGTVAASQEIFQALLKARKKKPIVITMGDIAASGGYYIAAAGDAIFANPGTITGSIGVITSYLNFYDLLNKIGVKGIVIKAGEYKDIGNPTRPLTEEERKILQSLLNETYNQFIKDVATGRKISKEKVSQIAKGLIYTGSQAKINGLVDFLGDYNKALKHAQYLAKTRFPELKKKYGKNDIPIEETWKELSIFEILTGAANKNLKINNSVLEEKLFKPYSYSKYQPLWLLE